MFTLVAACFLIVGVVFMMSGMVRLIFCLALLLGGSFVAVSATKANVGVEGFEHQEGISLRQDSTNRRTGFFVYYGSRSHRGGGILGGK
jgi:hypothetical protein